MSVAHAFGGRAILVAPDFPVTSHAARARALGDLGHAIAAGLPDADVVVGGTTLLVAWLAEDVDAQLLATRASQLEGIVLRRRDATHELRGPAKAREHEIAVVYDGADLSEVAAFAGLSVDAVVALHSERMYTALVAGFLPGFAYLGDVDPRLAKPRLGSPRIRVPAGSVGVAGPMTGVYPFASPGGWNLLGRAHEPKLFDPMRAPARRIAPMDRVRFVATDVAPPSANDVAHVTRREPMPDVARSALRIVSGGALATVQDRGRVGRLGCGIPRSGALDLVTLAFANAAVENADDAAAIEIPRGAIVVEACGAIVVSVDGAPAMRLASGARLEIPVVPGRSVRYLAVQGGVDVPIVLGARATLLVAGFGGLEGRRLRPGDVLPIGDDLVARSAASSIRRDNSLHGAADAADDSRATTDGPVLLTIRRAPPDPALDDASWDALLEGDHRVSNRSDRVGTRLDGEAVPRHARDVALPEPILPGAVQITTDGGIVVLGPDAAVTGGYPVAGVLDDASLGRLGRAAPGRVVRFVAA